MKKHTLLLSLTTASILYGAEGVFELGKVDVSSTSDTSSSTTTVIDAQAVQE